MSQKIILAVASSLVLFLLIMPRAALAQPVISSVFVLDVTATTATITWTTDIESDSRVKYGTTTPPPNSEYDSAWVTVHRITLGNLSPETTYCFNVTSVDKDDNSATSPPVGDYYIFETGAIEEDSVTLYPDSGIYGDDIETTITVEHSGTYHICWDFCNEDHRLKSYRATEPGSYSFDFRVPEARRGSHNVYLANDSYSSLDRAGFEVFPRVEIDPEDGPVGTEIAINGYGFETGEWDIELSYRDMVIIEGLRADSLGSWLIFYTIPPSPQGFYSIEVKAEEAAEECEYWREQFEVTPEISLSSTLGTVGQTVTIWGTGFRDEEGDIKFTIDGEVVKKDIYADEDGSWQTSFSVPAIGSGRHTIDASGRSTRASEVTDVRFIVTMGVSVEPGSAYVGDSIIVRGGAFAPGERHIKVTFDGTIIADGITADGNGSWETSFVLLSSSYGPHTIDAYGDVTKVIDVEDAILTTKAKIVLNAGDVSVGSSIGISGSGFNNNEILTVNFDGTTVLTGVGTDGNGNFLTTFIAPSSQAGGHTVTVTDAAGVSASATFTMESKPPATSQLISPKGGSKVRSGEVDFQWRGITDVSGIYYALEISSDANFAVVLESKAGIPEPRYKLSREEALLQGSYYWRVKAIDGAGNEGQWTSPGSFTVAPGLPSWLWILVVVVIALGVIIGIAYRHTRFRV